MSPYLEVWTPGGATLIPLTRDRITLGTGPSNDVPLPGDAAVSRMHAAFERYEAGWCVRDLNSRNGTYVNGERLWGERPVRPGDEIRVGATRIVYRVEEAEDVGMATATIGDVPPLTPRERDVLDALCAPLADADAFTEPATIRAMAAALFVTEPAIKQHLSRLYDKFGVSGDGERRRFRLANEAIRRNAVNVRALRERKRGPS